MATILVAVFCAGKFKEIKEIKIREGQSLEWGHGFCAGMEVGALMYGGGISAYVVPDDEARMRDNATAKRTEEVEKALREAANIRAKIGAHDIDTNDGGLSVLGCDVEWPRRKAQDETSVEADPKLYPLPILLLATVYEKEVAKPIKPGEVPHFNALTAVRDAVAAEFAEADAQKLPCETSTILDGAVDADKLSAPVDLVKRLAKVAQRAEKACASWDHLTVTEAGVCAIIAELAAMGGEALPSVVEVLDASFKVSRDLSSEASGAHAALRYLIPILAAKDTERDTATKEAEVLRAKAAELEARVALLVFAHKAAVYANAILGMDPMDIDLEFAANIIESGKAPDAWEKAVLEYAAKARGT